MLIEIRAAAVNFSDTLIVDGKYQSLPPLPFVPGRTVSGVVAQTASDVCDVRVGDRVIGFLEHGGYAELAAVRSENVQPMPRTLDYDAAVGIANGAQTAYFALADRVHLQADETILVTGASGVVGLASIELAKAFGAGRTIAAVRSPEAEHVVRSYGADDVVSVVSNDLRDGLRTEILRLTAGKGVDCIVELVGGDVFEAAVRCLAWRGRLVTLGFVSGRIPSLKMNYPLLRNITISGMQWTNYREREPAWVRKAQTEINELIDGGRLHAHVAATFSLDEAATALEKVRGGGTYGKIVLLPSP